MISGAQPLTNASSRALRSPRGFSLVELLSVIAVISILTGVAISSFSAVGSRNFTMQTSQMSDILARAREYAVANNTYTWVAFYANPATGTQQATVYVAVLASNDGTSQILPAGYSLGSTAVWPGSPTAASQNYQPIDKLTSFPGIGLSPAGSYTLSTTNGPVSNAKALATAATFAINVPGLGATETFGNSIEFTPSGEAKVEAAQDQSIEFDLCQYRGSVASSNSIAVVQVNGFTGSAQVYQP